MKKIYVRPETRAIEIKPSGMLCSSGLNGDYSSDTATENAKVRLFDDWDAEE
jgi:hypothetical protein